MERAGDQRPVPRRAAARPAHLRQGRPGGRRPALAGAPGRRPAAPGLARRRRRRARRACSRTTACVAAGFLDLLQVTGDPVWLERAGVLLDTALEHFAAEDGGFFDTADDAEALVARPRDPSDNASPSGLSSLDPRAVDVRRRDRLGPAPGRRRGGAGERRRDRRAGAAVRRLVAGRRAGDARRPGRGGHRGRPDRASGTRSSDGLAATPVPSWSWRTSPTDEIPLLVGRVAVDGRPAAYVCRGFVCERPVTTVDELEAALSR